MTDKDFQNTEARPFSFSDEVDRLNKSREKRDLVILSATALISAYATGIAVVSLV